MTAYAIFDIEVTDPERYEDYKKLAPPAIAAYDGTYLARGGKVDVLEGDWNPSVSLSWSFRPPNRRRTGSIRRRIVKPER